MGKATYGALVGAYGIFTGITGGGDSFTIIY